jgi:hypothetical protein
MNSDKTKALLSVLINLWPNLLLAELVSRLSFIPAALEIVGDLPLA